MIFIIYSLLFIILIIVGLFAFPKFSPIPYFPSNKKDLPLIINSLKLKNNQTVIDLGAGDGVVVFEAAKNAYDKKLNTQFVAVDINPVLLFIMYLHRLFHPNRKNIKVIYGDMFKFNFMNFRNLTNFITIYLYISPWFLEKTISNIKNQISKFSIVSYMYEISSLKKYEKKINAYKHPIFTYNPKHRVA